MKKQKNDSIIAEVSEFEWDLKNGIVRYRGQRLAEGKETEQGWLEMHYCDEKGNLIPNTPTVIMRPDRLE